MMCNHVMYTYVKMLWLFILQVKTTSLKKTLVKYTSKGKYDQLLSTLFKRGTKIEKANVRNRLQIIIRKEVDSMKNSLENDVNNPLEEPFVWKTFLKKAKHSCPLLYGFVTAALTTVASERSMKTTKGFPLRPIQGAVLSTIIHQNFPRRVKSFQVLNGLQLFMSGAECRVGLL